MPERIYNGPHAEVEVPLPDGGSITVAHGQSADFPNDVAKSLDEQGETWLRKGQKPTPKEKSEGTETADGGKE